MHLSGLEEKRPHPNPPIFWGKLLHATLFGKHVWCHQSARCTACAGGRMHVPCRSYDSGCPMIMPNTSSSYPALSLSLSLVPSIRKPQSMNAQEKKLSCYGYSQSQQTTISQLIFTRHYLLTIHLHNKQASTTHLHTKPASTPHLHSKLASTARFYNKPASLFWRKCHRKASFLSLLLVWTEAGSPSCFGLPTLLDVPFHVHQQSLSPSIPSISWAESGGLRRSIFSTPCCRSCAINLVLLSASLDTETHWFTIILTDAKT